MCKDNSHKEQKHHYQAKDRLLIVMVFSAPKPIISIKPNLQTNVKTFLGFFESFCKKVVAPP
jgi:hypothetical protein